MDFAIAPVRRAAAMPPGRMDRRGAGAGCDWAVLCIHECRGAEVAQHLARFGHRSHAEAFLADLLGADGRIVAVRDGHGHD